MWHDQPSYIRYTLTLDGDHYRTLAGLFNKAGECILADKLPYTLIISFSTHCLWLIAIPISIYSATHPYSLVDYIATIRHLSGGYARISVGIVPGV